MPNLTKTTAKQHCRTCLIKVNFEEEEFQMDNSRTPKSAYNSKNKETKDCINIMKNGELQSIIHKYICNNASESFEMGYPQHICLSCFNKIQQTDKFLQQAQGSAKTLKELFESASEIATDGQSSRDIYKLLLKDSLMETESVLLDNNTPSNQINADVNNPDPFSNNTASVIDEDNPKMSKDDSEIEQSDDDRERTRNSLTDLLNNECTSERKTSKSDDSSNHELENDLKPTNFEKPETRLRTKQVQQLAEPPLVIKKKKRRTKKEMKEFRQKQLEREEKKNKRRQKGTKNSFKCTKCNHCFAHKITLDAHIRKVHEGNKRPFRCDRCDKSYTFIGGLYTHIKEIHEAEVRSYACDFPNCDRIYTSFIAMQKHKRLKHTDTKEQKKYVCEQCGATFNQTGNLKYHRRTKHPTEDEKAEKERDKERYECTICKKLFHSRYTLKYHTLQLHTNDTKYECNVCGRRMAKKFMLVQHMLVHSTDKIPCEHCGKQFIRKFELEAHIKAVHMKLKPFECQFCLECFASRKTLRHHEYIHTGEKPYVCDLCGQAYRQQTCLKNHRKSHEKMGTDAFFSANINKNLMSTAMIDGNQPETARTNLEPDTATIVT